MSFAECNSEFQPTSKDGKILFPMLSQFLSKLDCKFEKMLGDMRYEFQQAIQARDSKILTLETELSRVKE